MKCRISTFLIFLWDFLLFIVFFSFLSPVLKPVSSEWHRCAGHQHGCLVCQAMWCLNVCAEYLPLLRRCWWSSPTVRRWRWTKTTSRRWTRPNSARWRTWPPSPSSTKPPSCTTCARDTSPAWSMWGKHSTITWRLIYLVLKSNLHPWF